MEQLGLLLQGQAASKQLQGGFGGQPTTAAPAVPLGGAADSIVGAAHVAAAAAEQPPDRSQVQRVIRALQQQQVQPMQQDTGHLITGHPLAASAAAAVEAAG